MPHRLGPTFFRLVNAAFGFILLAFATFCALGVTPSLVSTSTTPWMPSRKGAVTALGGPHARSYPQDARQLFQLHRLVQSPTLELTPTQ